MNIFERAVRAKLRFETTRGALSTEQLLDMPLTARDGFSLDETAQAVAARLEAVQTKSFVKVTPNKVAAENELRLEILKHVIESKLADQKAAETRVANEERRRQLLDALAAKEGEELAGMDKKSILKELEKLS